ncbi:hypothetical protein P3S68_010185 [Capsicum galapagoense]
MDDSTESSDWAFAVAVFYIVMQCLGAICVPMMSSVVTPREMALVLRLLVLLFLSTVSYVLLMPREMPATPMFLFWQCSSFIWPLSFIIGIDINPARNLGDAIVYNGKHARDDHLSFTSMHRTKGVA